MSYKNQKQTQTTQTHYAQALKLGNKNADSSRCVDRVDRLSTYSEMNCEHRCHDVIRGQIHIRSNAYFCILCILDWLDWNYQRHSLLETKRWAYWGIFRPAWKFILYDIRFVYATLMFHMEENSHIVYSKPNAERTEESWHLDQRENRENSYDHTIIRFRQHINIFTWKKSHTCSIACLLPMEYHPTWRCVVTLCYAAPI